MTEGRSWRSWRNRRNRAAFPLLAVLLHAGAVAVLYLRSPSPPALTSSAAGTDSPPIEIEVEVLAEPHEIARVAVLGRALSDDSPAKANAGPASAQAIRGDSESPPQDPLMVPSGDESGDAPAEPAASIALVRPATVDIGIGGVNRFLPRSAEAVDQAETVRAVNQAVRGDAREREQALGLGPEGPVLAALADGTSRSIAPVRGRAVFVATSNAAGEVVSLALEDAEGGRPGWADAGRIALAELKGKKLRVPPGTTRAVMKIEVVSAWKLPNGQDPKADVTLFHIPVAKGEGKDSPKVSILDPIPKVRVDYYEPSPGVKIPLLSIQLDVFSANTDPSNLGARPRRVIHTHVVDTKVM